MIKTFGLQLFLVLLILLVTIQTGYTQKRVPAAGYHSLNGENYVASKNYYLITLFEQLPGVKAILAHDSTLMAIGLNKMDSLVQSLKTCGKDGYCYTRHIKFSDAEIAQAGQRLKSLYQPGNALGRLVSEHLVPSGAYILFQHLSPADMLDSAWVQDARGINFAIGVYAEGNRPNYPNIDSASLGAIDPVNKSAFIPAYVNILYNTCALVAAESELHPSFYAVPLAGALHFLEMNERNQAADFEPMTLGENKAAYARARSIRWNSYKYSLIMVPGAGPDQPSVALSAEGMLRCSFAAIEYRRGLAPFILTSGGKVHPYKTKYCEAIEMKRYLIEKMHIPANAILIDPHARHTTTNMRNTARIIFRYGLPFGKPALTCTTRGQSNMIEQTLTARCLKELHEVPYKNGQRLSETALEFYPLPEAMQINPMEPMDP